MPEQGVIKGVTEAVISGVKSQLFRTITGGAEQRVVSPPVSGDYKGGTSVVIPSTQVIAAGVTDQIDSCVVTDDEGNVFSDAFDVVEWSVDDTDNGTVDDQGNVSKIGATQLVVTSTCLGQTDTCAVDVA